jgi:hypothetical protein
MSQNQSACERRTVRIPTAGLVNGWRRIIEADVAWVCPVCGGPRGDVFPAIAYDGRHQMHVDGWRNPRPEQSGADDKCDIQQAEHDPRDVLLRTHRPELLALVVCAGAPGPVGHV